MPRTPLHAPPLSGALVAVLAVVACVPKTPQGPDAATAATDDGSTSGAGSTSQAPDEPTAATTGDPPDDTTAGAPETTAEPGTSDSGDTTGGPSLTECPYAPPGVAVALARSLEDVPEDLSVRPCGTADAFAHRAVFAVAPDKLVLSACDDFQCGACDESDLLTLELDVPAPLPGLPIDPGPGDCAGLVATWDRPTDDPALCTISSLAVLRNSGGGPEPVPRFMYRHSGSLPATDVVGPFALTGADAGPGAQTCPCDADCCTEPPGARRVQFTAKLGMAEIEVPAIDPGDVVPAFAFGTPEGDDLFGELALVRALVPAACGAPAQHEWILRVTP